MNLRVIKAGVQDTLQDMGRYGWQHLGINPGGTMDRLSAQVANLLVGNAPQEAVIEMHFPASAFFFERASLIAISGADFSATVNGEEIPLLQPILISKYSILQFHQVRSGARAYLAVHGGFNVPVWLGSQSTLLKANAGGYHGRALQKDDEISLRSDIDLSSLLQKQEFVALPWKADMAWLEEDSKEIFALPGHEWDRLEDHSRELFLHQLFTITSQSDRMGYRLKSAALQETCHDEIVSSAVSFGTIQLLPEGQLIILMADHQTSGGYPRIAHVITAHLPRLAQMKPGETLEFRLTDHAKAEELLAKQQQHLLQLQNACKFKVEQLFHA